MKAFIPCLHTHTHYDLQNHVDEFGVFALYPNASILPYIVVPCPILLFET